MKKMIALILAALLALSTLTVAFAATYTDKDTVKKVQQALNDAGYECGTPDGIAGKKAAAAITQYQTDKGLNATGTATDELLVSLGLAEAEETAGPEQDGEAEASEEEAPAEATEPMAEASETEEQGDARADDSAWADGEVPAIPEEVIAATGGIPDNIEAMADRFDLAKLKEMNDQWDGKAAIKALQETGSFTMPSMGLKWDEDGLNYVYLDGYGDDYLVVRNLSDNELSVEREGNQGGTISSLQLSFANGYHFYASADVYESARSDSFVFQQDDSNFKSSGSGYVICVGATGEGYFIWVSEVTDGHMNRWNAFYDETGSLSDVTYQEY